MKNQVLEMLNKKDITLVMEAEKIDRIIESCIKQNFTVRKIYNKLLKENNIETEQRNQKEVASLIINIEWKNSNTWGRNPKAGVLVRYKDGSFESRDYKSITGCGFDKESQAFSEVFNDFLLYRLWDKQDKGEIDNVPYGIRFDKKFSPCFVGGVGMSCYCLISKFIGGKLEGRTPSRKINTYIFTLEG